MKDERKVAVEPEQKKPLVAGLEDMIVADEPTAAPRLLMAGPPFTAGLTKLAGPPNVPMSNSL